MSDTQNETPNAVRRAHLQVALREAAHRLRELAAAPEPMSSTEAKSLASEIDEYARAMWVLDLEDHIERAPSLGIGGIEPFIAPGPIGTAPDTIKNKPAGEGWLDRMRRAFITAARTPP